jgi:Bacterial regulatory protein, Fis family/Sigma-54 interaction domain
LNVYSSITILLLFNLPLWGMAFVSLARLKGANARWLFPGLAAALSLWASPLVLVKGDFLSQDMIALCSRLTFSGGAIAVTLLFLFCDGFGEARRSKVRYLVVANGVFVLGSVLSGFVEQGVVAVANGFAPVHGPLHKYYVISMSATVLGAFLRLALIYRKSESTLLRFQIASIAGFGLLGFAFPIINNGVFPILIPNYSFPVFGVIGVLFFHYGIFRMLLRGELLFIRRLFHAIQNSKAWQMHENIISLSRLTNMLNSVVIDNMTQFREVYPFVNEAGAAVDMHVQSNTEPGGYSNVTLFNELVMPKWNRGLLDNLVKLESDNKRLSFNLLKAETIIKEKWLTNTVRELTRGQVLDSASYPINHYKEECADNLRQNREVFGVDLLVASPELFAVLEKIKRIAPGTGTVFFDGEDGTGKALLAQALHFFRTKSVVDILECSRHSLNLAAQLNALKAAGAGGVILRNLHFLTNEELASLTTSLNSASERFRLYATVRSMDELWRRLPDAAVAEAMQALPVISVTPLRSRKDDLRLQIFHFAAAITERTGIPWQAIRSNFIDAAAQYGWPGNTTELVHRLETILLTEAGTAELAAEHLKAPTRQLASPEGLNLSPLEEAERQVIGDCLQRKRFNQRQTAMELQITINTLKAKMGKYGLRIPERE